MFAQFLSIIIIHLLGPDHVLLIIRHLVLTDAQLSVYSAVSLV